MDEPKIIDEGNENASVAPQKNHSFFKKVFSLKVFGIIGVSFNFLYIILSILSYFGALPAGIMDFDETVSGLVWLIIDIVYTLVISLFFASQTKLIKLFQTQKVWVRKTMAMVGFIAFFMAVVFLSDSWVDYTFFAVYALVFLRIFIGPLTAPPTQKAKKKTTT